MTDADTTTQPGRIVKTLAKLLGLNLATAPDGTITASRDLGDHCRIVFSDLCDNDGSIRVRITAGVDIPVGDVVGLD